MRWCVLAVVSASLACQPPPVPVPLEDAGTPPSLELSAVTVDLGGAALRFGERIRREGTVSIRAHDLISPLELAVTASASVRLERSTFTLPPEVWVSVPVAIELDRVGRVTGAVTFTSPEGLVPPVSVSLVAVGASALDCLLVEPAAIDFGSLNVGCPVRQRTVRITNDCAVPRLLNDAEVTPRAAPFVLSALTSLPRRLAPGESWSGLVDFLGGPLALHDAQLRFTVDGELGAVIGLQGLRTDTGSREFSFFAPSRQVDLLVVLDNSPTFTPRRSAAQQRVIASLTNFNWYTGPLRVGVVGTGEVSLSGGIAENDQAGFTTTVTDALNAVPQGDELERCLDTAANFSGFWRPAARRRAVCITDAPEQSLAPLTAIEWLADAGVQWDVIGPPLVAPDGGCALEDLDDGGHTSATAALGGSVTSICGPWQLPSPGPVPIMPLLYPLSVQPSFPITVLVDGLEIPATEWNWEPTIRTLEVQHRPQSSLVIRESLVCTP